MRRETRESTARARHLRAVTFSVSIAVLGASTWTLDAYADETTTRPGTDPRARAQHLFDSALADAEAGDYAAACPKFLASQEADPKASTLLNLANCYEKNGQTASAWGAFREAEVLARRASKPEWQKTARSRAQSLEPHLLRLSIVVDESHLVKGLVVTRDGVTLAKGEWGLSIPVDPGEHVITATADGYEPWETRVVVQKPLTRVEIPKLTEHPPAPLPTPTTASPSGAVSSSGGGWTAAKTTGFIVAGVGLATLGASGVLGLMAQRDYDDARARCSNGARGCPTDAVNDADSAFGIATRATVVFAVGAALLVGGAALFVLAPSSKRSAARPARVAIGPAGLSASW